MWSHCGLHLHFPDDYEGCTFSSLPLSIVGVGFRKIPFKPFVYFSMILFAFFCYFVCLATFENNSLFSLGTTNFFKLSNSTKMKVFHFLVHILTAIFLLFHFPVPCTRINRSHFFVSWAHFT